jgi:hypothetical protein
VIALDYTKSNQWSGKKSYGGKPLHYLDPDNLEKNPYIQARGCCCMPILRRVCCRCCVSILRRVLLFVFSAPRV